MTLHPGSITNPSWEPCGKRDKPQILVGFSQSLAGGLNVRVCTGTGQGLAESTASRPVRRNRILYLQSSSSERFSVQECDHDR